jgi:hypothetical protein
MKTALFPDHPTIRLNARLSTRVPDAAANKTGRTAGGRDYEAGYEAKKTGK